MKQGTEAVKKRSSFRNGGTLRFDLTRFASMSFAQRQGLQYIVMEFFDSPSGWRVMWETGMTGRVITNKPQSMAASSENLHDTSSSSITAAASMKCVASLSGLAHVCRVIYRFQHCPLFQVTLASFLRCS